MQSKANPALMKIKSKVLFSVRGRSVSVTVTVTVTVSINSSSMENLKPSRVL